MKKAFIQKLSIAMASALVITAAAPATADAAAAMKMDKSSRILYLNDDNMTNTADTYDFSIKNKPKNYSKTYSFKWYAENEKIVDVAAGGLVTAKKVGQTTVKVDVIKKSTGKIYKSLKTTVTVKANADTVTVKNAPEDGEMAIGTTYDFNRTMKASNGGTATDKTEWFLTSDKEGKETSAIASVDKNGVVTALKPGTFYITAKTFQSDKYKHLGYTAVSTPVEVKVYASITEAKNTTTSKFQLTFDADMSKAFTKDTITVTNAAGVKQVVKSLAFNTAGTVATVELWTPMTDKVLYKVTVPEVEAVEFTASIGTPVSITVTAPTLVADNESAELKSQLKDANGVVVNAGTNSRIVYSTTATSEAWINGDKITIFQIGKVVPVKATYYTGTYDSNGNEIKFESEIVSVTCVDTLDTVVSTSTATITSKASGKDADWDNAKMTLPVNDSNKYLQIRYVQNDGDVAYTNSGEKETWSFESTDTSKLIVNKTTGKLLPLGEGQVVVIAKSGTFTNTFVVNITAKRVLSSITPSTDGIKLSNSKTVLDSKTIKLTIKDNYGEDYTADTNLVKVEALGSNDTKNAADDALNFVETKDSVKFTVTGNGKAGNYQFKLTKGDKDNERSAVVTVSVVEPTTAISYGRIKVDTASFDTKVTSGGTLGKIRVNLASVDNNGTEINPITSGVVYTIKHSDGTQVGTGYYNTTDGVMDIEPVIVSGGAYSKLKTGTYTVTATVNGETTIPAGTTGNEKKTIMAGIFELKDTQATTAVKTKSKSLDASIGEDLKAALAKCFELADNANNTRSYAVTNIKTTVTDDAVTSNAGTYNVRVEKVTVTEVINGVSLNTEVTVNETIEVTVK